MLMPQELRKYAFTHAIRGYSTAEVDEYIEFLCEKYEEIYRENDELTRKLEAALRALDAAKNNENTASALTAEAKRVSARMLAEAEAQKKRIVTDAEEYADRIIADADAHVSEQAQVLENMRQTVLSFRDELYSRYSRQIDEIEAFAAAAQAVSGMGPLPQESSDVTYGDEETEVLPAYEAEEAEMPDPIAEAEESIESLFSDEAEESDIPAETETADVVDEDEVAATDEVLLFFDSMTPQEGAEDVPYAEVDADVYAIAEQNKDKTEFSYEEDEEDAALNMEDLLPVLEEKFAEESEQESDGDPAQESDADEEEQPDGEEESESDENLLKNLREAFQIQFETFTTESSAADNADDFRFLEESEEEEEEPAGLLARLKNAMDAGKSSDTADKNKKESKEKELRR